MIIFFTILQISLLFHLLHHKTFLFSATKIQCPAICWGSWLVRYQSNELLGLTEMTCSGKNIYHTTVNCFHDLKAKVILDLKLPYPSSTNPAKLQADRRAQKCHYWAFFHLLQSEFWINWLLILLFGELPSYLSFLPMTHCSILPIFDLSTFWVQVYQTVVYLHLPVRTIFNGTEMHFLTVQNWIHIKTMMAIVMKFGLHSTNWVTDRRTDYALSTCSFSRYPATMKFHSRIPWYPRFFFAFSKSWSAC